MASASYVVDTNISTVLIGDIFKNQSPPNASVFGHPSRKLMLNGSSIEARVALSFLFCTIGVVGIIGNFLVIYVILSDRKMRNSVTNLFIMNLAVADFLIMVIGVPEIVQFMMDQGWLLGEAMCRFQRFVLVVSLYASVMTLVSVCIERYIAIVHPIQAHIWCSRRRILLAIACIWPFAVFCGLPTVLYNKVHYPTPRFPIKLCAMVFPSRHYQVAFKYFESLVYYLIPVVLQIVMYAVIGKKLFAGTDKLHRKQKVRTADGVEEKESDAIKARKGVIKMLVASVMIYIISYSPVQIPVFYNTFSKTPFRANWSFLVSVMTMGYINSAANPILYSIFSQNFRRKFKLILCRCLQSKESPDYKKTTSSNIDSSGASRYTAKFQSIKMSVTQVSEI